MEEHGAKRAHLGPPKEPRRLGLPPTLVPAPILPGYPPFPSAPMITHFTGQPCHPPFAVINPATSSAPNQPMLSRTHPMPINSAGTRTSALLNPGNMPSYFGAVQEQNGNIEGRFMASRQDEFWRRVGSRSSLMKPIAARRIHDSLFVKPASAVYDSLARDQLLLTRQISLSDKEVKDEVAAAVYKKRKTIREGQNNRYLSLAYLKHILDDAVVEDLSKFVPNASRGSYSVNECGAR